MIFLAKYSLAVVTSIISHTYYVLFLLYVYVSVTFLKREWTLSYTIFLTLFCRLLFAHFFFGTPCLALSLSTHMSMFVILMVENWIEILGFPKTKFAILVFYSFFEALDRSLLVLAFVESICVHKGFC